MKKNIQMHNESVVKKKVDAPKDGDALPGYLLDREVVTRAKVRERRGGCGGGELTPNTGVVELVEAKEKGKGRQVERASAAREADF